MDIRPAAGDCAFQSNVPHHVRGWGWSELTQNTIGFLDVGDDPLNTSATRGRTRCEPVFIRLPSNNYSIISVPTFVNLGVHNCSE